MAAALDASTSVTGALKPEFRLSSGVHIAGAGIVLPGDDVKAVILAKALSLKKEREQKQRSVVSCTSPIARNLWTAL